MSHVTTTGSERSRANAIDEGEMLSALNDVQTTDEPRVCLLDCFLLRVVSVLGRYLLSLPPRRASEQVRPEQTSADKGVSDEIAVGSEKF